MLHCRVVPGIPGTRLNLDLGVACFNGPHASITIAAVATILLFVLGFPTGALLILWRNRAQLHDPSAPGYVSSRKKYGALFLQYDPHAYWFETFQLTFKMIMTGALAVVAPGSTVQPLLAVLLAFFNVMVTLKIAPFRKDSEDWSSAIGGTVLFVTLLIGLVMQADPDTYDDGDMGVLLIIITVMVVVAEVGTIVLLDYDGLDKIRGAAPCCKSTSSRVNKVQNIKKRKSSGGKSTTTKTKVAPSKSESSTSPEERVAELRAARKKYGANSKEYQALAKRLGVM
jgi:hypothetical protein